VEGVGGDDDVVEKRDADEVAGGAKPLGDFEVGRGGGGFAARVVVDGDDAGGVGRDGGFEDLAGVN
jgi:hypothetical protein